MCIAEYCPNVSFKQNTKSPSRSPIQIHLSGCLSNYTALIHSHAHPFPSEHNMSRSRQQMELTELAGVASVARLTCAMKGADLIRTITAIYARVAQTFVDFWVEQTIQKNVNHTQNRKSLLAPKWEFFKTHFGILIFYIICMHAHIILMHHRTHTHVHIYARTHTRQVNERKWYTNIYQSHRWRQSIHPDMRIGKLSPDPGMYLLFRKAHCRIRRFLNQNTSFYRIIDFSYLIFSGHVTTFNLSPDV